MTSPHERTQQAKLSRVLRALERSRSVTYILDSDFRITYCNPAWDRFAQENGAPQLNGDAVTGLYVFDAIPHVLKSAYSEAFRGVLTNSEVWEKAYECSSPTLFRKFRMRIHLLEPQRWLLITNNRMVEHSVSNVAPHDPSVYVDANGLITMCAHCRCSKRVEPPDEWDFVPDYLQLRPNSDVRLSHGLCPLCFAYYYPDNPTVPNG